MVHGVCVASYPSRAERGAWALGTRLGVCVAVSTKAMIKINSMYIKNIKHNLELSGAGG